MSDWKTVIRVDTIQEAFTIRSQLELEGFEVMLLDELSIQLAPGFSPATGGPRVQVRQTEFEKARAYLIELGHISDIEVEKSSRFAPILKFTSRVPFLNKLRAEAQLLFLGIVLLSMVIIPIAIINSPEEDPPLAHTMWCVVEVKHNGETISPLPSNFNILVNGCANTISFNKEQSTLLPAYGDSLARVSYNISDEYIWIHAPTNATGKGKNNLFIGKFRYFVKGRTLRLVSKTTRITLSRI